MPLLAPIGCDSQIEETLGMSSFYNNEVHSKVELVKANIQYVVKVNGARVFNVTVDGETIRYNLRNRPSHLGQKYYYPIRFASIEISSHLL